MCDCKRSTDRGFTFLELNTNQWFLYHSDLRHGLEFDRRVRFVIDVNALRNCVQFIDMGLSGVRRGERDRVMWGRASGMEWEKGGGGVGTGRVMGGRDGWGWGDDVWWTNGNRGGAPPPHQLPQPCLWPIPNRLTDGCKKHYLPHTSECSR